MSLNNIFPRSRLDGVVYSELEHCTLRAHGSGARKPQSRSRRRAMSFSFLFTLFRELLLYRMCTVVHLFV